MGMNVLQVVRLFGDSDIYDDVFDMSVTVCLPDREEDYYDRFINEICRKVQINEHYTRMGNVVAHWYNFIGGNIDDFRAFSKQHWDYVPKENDDLIEMWIAELHGMFAGMLPDSMYETMYRFARRLRVVEC